MSDPMTNSDIEDVLSSIRRLVSEPREPAATRMAKPGEKLVLTPALRVASAAAAEPGDAPAAAEGTAVPTAAEDAPLATEKTTQPDEPRRAAMEKGPVIEGLARQREPVVIPKFHHTSRSSEPTLEETIAELEAAIAASAEEFEPDGSEVVRSRRMVGLTGANDDDSGLGLGDLFLFSEVFDLDEVKPARADPPKRAEPDAAKEQAEANDGSADKPALTAGFSSRRTIVDSTAERPVEPDAPESETIPDKPAEFLAKIETTVVTPAVSRPAIIRSRIAEETEAEAPAATLGAEDDRAQETKTVAEDVAGDVAQRLSAEYVLDGEAAALQAEAETQDAGLAEPEDDDAPMAAVTEELADTALNAPERAEDRADDAAEPTAMLDDAEAAIDAAVQAAIDEAVASLTAGRPAAGAESGPEAGPEAGDEASLAPDDDDVSAMADDHEVVATTNLGEEAIAEDADEAVATEDDVVAFATKDDDEPAAAALDVDDAGRHSDDTLGRSFSGLRESDDTDKAAVTAEPADALPSAATAPDDDVDAADDRVTGVALEDAAKAKDNATPAAVEAEPEPDLPGDAMMSEADGDHPARDTAEGETDDLEPVSADTGGPAEEPEAGNATTEAGAPLSVLPLVAALNAATPPAPPGIRLDPESDWIDEDTLREIVRELLREELQGALGIRITRNVRKLVRAEISRALTEHELE